MFKTGIYEISLSFSLFQLHISSPQCTYSGGEDNYSAGTKESIWLCREVDKDTHQIIQSILMKSRVISPVLVMDLSEDVSVLNRILYNEIRNNSHPYSNNQYIIHLKIITHPICNSRFQDLFLKRHRLIVNF